MLRLPGGTLFKFMGLMNLTFQVNPSGSEGLDNCVGPSDAAEITKEDYYNKNRSYSFIDYHYIQLTEEEYERFLQENKIQLLGFDLEEFLKVKSGDYMKAISCYRKLYYNNYVFPLRNDSMIKDVKLLVNMYFAFLEAVYLFNQCYPRAELGDLCDRKAMSSDEVKLYNILYESCDNRPENHHSFYHRAVSQVWYYGSLQELDEPDLRYLIFATELVWLFPKLKVIFENLSKDRIEDYRLPHLSGSQYSSLFSTLSKEFNTFSSYYYLFSNFYDFENDLLRLLRLEKKGKFHLYSDLRKK